jgi:DNA polymerase-3 subunit epsilon/ATP-dependent DNA helicase DinG
VPGEALSCLVITRLPFDVPSDPVFAARAETFEDPFMEYSVPLAVLRFRQGFGRLIRSAADRGVMVALDSRLMTKRYGQAFLDALPPSRVQRGSRRDLAATVAEFVGRRR